MRRFELVEGDTKEFLEIDVQGTELTVRSGQIGTPGQSQTSSYPDTPAAKAKARWLIIHRPKGYEDVAGIKSLDLEHVDGDKVVPCRSEVAQSGFPRRLMGDEHKDYVPTPAERIPRDGLVIEFPECSTEHAIFLAKDLKIRLRGAKAQGRIATFTLGAGGDPTAPPYSFSTFLGVWKIGVRIRKADGSSLDLPGVGYPLQECMQQLLDLFKSRFPTKAFVTKAEALARKLIEKPGKRTTSLLYKDEAPGAFLVDWREADERIISLAASALGRGDIGPKWIDKKLHVDFDGVLTQVPLQFQPGEQDLTLRTLNSALQPTYEIRFVKASSDGDTLAFMALATDYWRTLESEYGDKVDAAFARLDIASPLFSS